MGMEAFYTRTKANEGRKLPLYAPDGTVTGDWLQVRHVWSDAFRMAEEAGLRSLQEQILGLGENPAPCALDAIKADAKMVLLASLIAGWSFDAECTPEVAAGFLRNAPQIAEQINRFGADSLGFFGDGPRNVKRGSKVKSDSAKL